MICIFQRMVATECILLEPEEVNLIILMVQVEKLRPHMIT